MSIVWNLLGVNITQKRRSRLKAIVAQLLLGIAGLVSITFICFQLGFGVGRTSLDPAVTSGHVRAGVRVQNNGHSGPED